MLLTEWGGMDSQTAIKGWSLPGCPILRTGGQRVSVGSRFFTLYWISWELLTSERSENDLCYNILDLFKWINFKKNFPLPNTQLFRQRWKVKPAAVCFFLSSASVTGASYRFIAKVRQWWRLKFWKALNPGAEGKSKQLALLVQRPWNKKSKIWALEWQRRASFPFLHLARGFYGGWGTLWSLSPWPGPLPLLLPRPFLHEHNRSMMLCHRVGHIDCYPWFWTIPLRCSTKSQPGCKSQSMEKLDKCTNCKALPPDSLTQ